MQRLARLRALDVNEHLACGVCFGYLVDATTIVECLHSFCRSCIVRHFETSNECPLCGLVAHKTKPLTTIRPDTTLQDIVYKLVPGLFKAEMQRRREFYQDHGDAAHDMTLVLTQEDRGWGRGPPRTTPTPENISVRLQLSRHLLSRRAKLPASDKRYLLCPAYLTVAHLKKFIGSKFNLPTDLQIGIFYLDEFLDDQYTVMDVACLYSWTRRKPLKINYAVYDVEELNSSSTDKLPTARKLTDKLPTASDDHFRCLQPVQNSSKVSEKRKRLGIIYDSDDENDPATSTLANVPRAAGLSGSFHKDNSSHSRDGSTVVDRPRCVSVSSLIKSEPSQQHGMYGVSNRRYFAQQRCVESFRTPSAPRDRKRKHSHSHREIFRRSLTLQACQDERLSDAESLSKIPDGVSSPSVSLDGDTCHRSTFVEEAVSRLSLLTNEARASSFDQDSHRRATASLPPPSRQTHVHPFSIEALAVSSVVTPRYDAEQTSEMRTPDIRTPGMRMIECKRQRLHYKDDPHCPEPDVIGRPPQISSALKIYQESATSSSSRSCVGSPKIGIVISHGKSMTLEDKMSRDLLKEQCHVNPTEQADRTKDLAHQPIKTEHLKCEPMETGSPTSDHSAIRKRTSDAFVTPSDVGRARTNIPLTMLNSNNRTLHHHKRWRHGRSLAPVDMNLIASRDLSAPITKPLHMRTNLDISASNYCVDQPLDYSRRQQLGDEPAAEGSGRSSGRQDLYWVVKQEANKN